MNIPLGHLEIDRILGGGPAMPALSDEIVLGMPHLCLGGLSETWLIKECGHRHWLLLAQATGRAVPNFCDAAGDPVDLTPQAAPQVRPDDGYIYPADGSSDGARYPAPRGSRRIDDAQVYQQQPQQQYYGQQQPYYDNRTYAPQYGQPLYAPGPYYQPRGLFNN